MITRIGGAASLRHWLTALAFSATVTATATAQSVAITNARIHTVSGAVIERGTVVISNGRITAVGAHVSVPAGARVIDAAGKVVTPGLIDSYSNVGTVEIPLSGEGTNDASTNLDQITAAFNAADNLNPLSTKVAITRTGGTTRLVVAPENGRSLIAGQGVLVDLGTQGPNITIHRNPVAMFAALGERGASLSGGGARGAAMLRLKEALQDASDYAANRAAFESRNRRDYALSRLDLEALVPVVRGQEPIVIAVNRASDILSALRLAREYNLKLIIAGGGEGWTVARELASAGVPVIVDALRNLPNFESLAITLENAARLNAAGVNVVFASFNYHDFHGIRQQAGNAVAYGMPFDAALRALTLNPARLWGIADQVGSIEVGKVADLVVWTGDPLELTTQVSNVFIAGRELPLETRQSLLLQRYRHVGGDTPPAYIK